MSPLGAGGRASVIGIELAIAVVGCLLGGWWLDGKLDTSPYLTLAGVVLGSIAGFWAMWKSAKAASEGD